MVQEIVCQVVAYVSKYPSAIHCRRCIPVVRKYRMGKVPEWRGEHNKEGRGHHEPVAVHWEIVMDAVNGEVERYAVSVVWEIAAGHEQKERKTNWKDESTYPSR